MWGSAPGRGAARALVACFGVLSALSALSHVTADTMGVKQRRERVTGTHVCRARDRVSFLQRAHTTVSGAITVDRTSIHRQRRTRVVRTETPRKNTARICTEAGASIFTSESENVHPSPQWFPCQSVRLWLAPSRPLLFSPRSLCLYVCVCRLAGKSANRHTQTHVRLSCPPKAAGVRTGVVTVSVCMCM